ncbi:Hypothetical predicted protein, partial [Scomber scombrus]
MEDNHQYAIETPATFHLTGPTVCKKKNGAQAGVFGRTRAAVRQAPLVAHLLASNRYQQGTPCSCFSGPGSLGLCTLLPCHVCTCPPLSVFNSFFPNLFCQCPTPAAAQLNRAQ